MTDEQKKRLKSGFEIVWHIASAIMNIISFAVAITSAVKGNFELAWEIVIAIIAVDSVLLVIFAVYATVLWFKIKAIEKQNEDELNKQLKLIENERKEIKEYKITTQKNIAFLEDCVEFSQSLNSECVIQVNKSLSDLAKCVEKISSIANNKDNFTKKYNRIVEYLEELKVNIKKRYNAFFTFSTEKLKTMPDLNFENRNLSIKNSITIKQLKTALFWNSKASKTRAIGDAQIITTFRDPHTYTHLNREVGKKVYTISGNTDFNHCLNNAHYFLNDINASENDNYQNENKEFKTFYNCTIVVPIFVQEASGKRYYGYLTADALNSDSSEKEVYNKQMIKIMKNAASTIAMFFNVMEQHWGDGLNTIKDVFINIPKPKNASLNSDKGIDFEIEFLNMVYNQKYKSYNSIEDEVVA